MHQPPDLCLCLPLAVALAVLTWWLFRDDDSPVTPGGNQMLVLGRHVGETIVVDGPCEITLLAAGRSDGRCRIGINADRSVTIMRKEIVDRPRRQEHLGEEQTNVAQPGK